MTEKKSKQAEEAPGEMTLYELYAGRAPNFKCDRAGNVVDLKEGDTVESDMPLDEMWPAKFIRADRTHELPGPALKKRDRRLGKATAAKRPPAPKPAQQDEGGEESADERDEDDHEDVTDQFPVAKSNDFKVGYVHKKGFTVTEGGKPTHDEPFRSSKDVTAHLEGLAGGQDAKPKSKEPAARTPARKRSK